MRRFFCTKQLRPVQILHQRLDGFTFRVSHLLNEAQVIPREDLGRLKKRTLAVCSSVAAAVPGEPRVPVAEFP